MKKVNKHDLLFGAIALGLMIFVIATNLSTGSITGWVIGDPVDITLVSPSNNVKTDYRSTSFIFKYPEGIAMEKCSLILNGGVVKITNSVMSPRDTRIKTDLPDGIYKWEIECVDTDGELHSSQIKTLFVGDYKEDEILITQNTEKTFEYEFEINDELDVLLEELVPNDVLIIKDKDRTYKLSIIRINYDPTLDQMTFVEMIMEPGSKRLKLTQEMPSIFDFNNDGEFEIVVEIVKVQKGLTTLRVTKAPNFDDEKVPVETQKPAPTSQTDYEGSNSRGFPAFLILAAVAIVVILLFFSKKKEEPKEEKEEVILIKASPKKVERKKPFRKAPAKKKATKKKPVKKKKAVKKKKSAVKKKKVAKKTSKKKKSAVKKKKTKRTVKRKTVKKKAAKKKPVKKKTAKRKLAKKKTVKRKAVKKKVAKRKSVKKKATKRKTAKKKVAKRKTVKRKAVKKKTVKRKATKRKAAKKKTAKRKSSKRKPSKGKRRR